MDRSPAITLSATLDPATGRIDFCVPAGEIFAAGLLYLLTEHVRVSKILPAVMPRVQIPMPAGRG
jgi:hypothetical protein